MAKVLVVEDETVLANAMADTLRAADHDVRTVYAGEKVMGTCQEMQPDLVLLDVRLGAVSGLDLLRQIKAEWPETEAVILTAYGSVELAVDAMKHGAADFLTKPIDLDVLAVSIDKVLAASRARRRLQQFTAAQQERLGQVAFIGRCPEIEEIRRIVDRVAERSESSGTLPAAMLLTGETGTGKDLLAGYIHSRLPQRDGPFVAVNCAAIPGELVESELFGHRRGAFSGATHDKAGLFETADGGTLLLDEIADMPLSLQPKLLRALESQSVRRVGETRDRPVQLCLIAATNRNLERAVAEQRFREDLFYRLKLVTFHLPPLRQRGDDLDLLADHFCQRLANKYGLPELSLSPEARNQLHEYAWPGNVRELLYALERATLINAGPSIASLDLRGGGSADASSAGCPAEALVQRLASGEPIAMDALERCALEIALEQTNGNVSAAARLLSIGREAMRYRMSKFGLVADREPELPAEDG